MSDRQRQKLEEARAFLRDRSEFYLHAHAGLMNRRSQTRNEREPLMQFVRYLNECTGTFRDDLVLVQARLRENWYGWETMPSSPSLQQLWAKATVRSLAALSTMSSYPDTSPQVAEHELRLVDEAVVAVGDLFLQARIQWQTIIGPPETPEEVKSDGED